MHKKHLIVAIPQGISFAFATLLKGLPSFLPKPPLYKEFIKLSALDNSILHNDLPRLDISAKPIEQVLQSMCKSFNDVHG